MLCMLISQCFDLCIIFIVFLVVEPVSSDVYAYMSIPKRERIYSEALWGCFIARMSNFNPSKHCSSFPWADGTAEESPLSICCKTRSKWKKWWVRTTEFGLGVAVAAEVPPCLSVKQRVIWYQIHKSLNSTPVLIFTDLESSWVGILKGLTGQLRAHTALPEDLTSVPSTSTGWLTTPWNSKGSDTFYPLWVPALGYTYPYKHINLKKIAVEELSN